MPQTTAFLNANAKACCAFMTCMQKPGYAYIWDDGPCCVDLCNFELLNDSIDSAVLLQEQLQKKKKKKKCLGGDFRSCPQQRKSPCSSAK